MLGRILSFWFVVNFLAVAYGHHHRHPSPTPRPTVTPTPRPTVTPSPTPTPPPPTPIPPTPTPTPVPTPPPPTPTPTPVPVSWPLVFSDDFSDPGKTIDEAATSLPGFNWYPEMFFGYGTNQVTYYSVATNILTIKDAADPWGDTLHTAHPDNGLGWRGTCFSIGQGLYVEARIRMMNVSSIGSNGWPSFWMDDINREAFRGIEAAEADIMEYNPSWYGGALEQYNFTLHDWIPGSGQIGSSNNEIQLLGVDFTAWHTYGMLMMPGGYVEAFFDGVAERVHAWQPGGTFSVTESAKFMLILGSARGGIPTMQVNWVHIYALDPAASVHTQ